MLCMAPSQLVETSSCDYYATGVITVRIKTEVLVLSTSAYAMKPLQDLSPLNVISLFMLRGYTHSLSFILAPPSVPKLARQRRSSRLGHAVLLCLS